MVNAGGALQPPALQAHVTHCSVCAFMRVPPRVSAVPHRQEAMGRAALVLQWRLHPQYQIGAATVGQLMEQFSSGGL